MRVSFIAILLVTLVIVYIVGEGAQVKKEKRPLQKKPDIKRAVAAAQKVHQGRKKRSVKPGNKRKHVSKRVNKKKPKVTHKKKPVQKVSKKAAKKCSRSTFFYYF